MHNKTKPRKRQADRYLNRLPTKEYIQQLRIRREIRRNLDDFQYV
ncbi:hypothetical protein UFOVP253_64 [uncultured Caudovirales phage]|uniref:Uncharacterized protein n=1 Tax=uncultured Caudovirales phage TaxID=2100421 RepID=A0A6J5LLW8_9CAUD|nr:hypothetical protein UFOVP253_64 [uncultured Caudovirales phage]